MPDFTKYDAYAYTVRMLDARNLQIAGLLAERDLLRELLAAREAELACVYQQLTNLTKADNTA